MTPITNGCGTITTTYSGKIPELSGGFIAGEIIYNWRIFHGAV
jgi:hypothetical protein